MILRFLQFQETQKKFVGNYYYRIELQLSLRESDLEGEYSLILKTLPNQS